MFRKWQKILEEDKNSQNMVVALDLLAETREEERIREASMKQRATRNYDSKVGRKQAQPELGGTIYNFGSLGSESISPG